MIFTTILALAAATTQAAPLDSLFARAASCTASSVSCSGTTDACCVPSNGKLVLSIQWLPGWCAANSCGSGILASAPDATWTLHGLWPDTCSGTEPSKTGCDSARQYSSIQSLVSGSPIYNDMITYWISYKGTDIASYDAFWVHEWGVHGTCYSTANTACVGSNGADVQKFFGDALAVRKTYDVYSALWNAGIKPDGSTYSTSAMTSAIQAQYPGVSVQYLCTGSYVNEIHLSLIGVGGGQIAKPSSYSMSGSTSACGSSIIYAQGPNGVIPPSGNIKTTTTAGGVKTTTTAAVVKTTTAAGTPFLNCPHSPCTTGSLLPASCDPCIAQIGAVYSHCTQVGWSNSASKAPCVDAVKNVCGLNTCCGTGASSVC